MRSVPSPRRRSRDKVAPPSWSTERGELCGAVLTRAGGGRTPRGPRGSPESRGEKSWVNCGPDSGETRGSPLRAPQQCAPRPPPRASLTRAQRALPARVDPLPGGGAAAGPAPPSPPPCRPRPAQARRPAPESRLGACWGELCAPCARAPGAAARGGCAPRRAPGVAISESRVRY